MAEVNPVGGGVKVGGSTAAVNNSIDQRRVYVSGGARAGSNKTKPAPSRRKIVDRRRSKSVKLPSDLERRKAPDRRAGSKFLTQPEPSPENDGDSNQPGKDADAATSLDVEREAHDLIKQKRLLASCERVMAVNYNVLALEDYPPNYQVAAALKVRDAYITAAGFASGAFVIGLSGILPAWLTGTSFGLALLFITLAFSELQSLLQNTPSLRRLLRVRRQMEFNALSHINYLEGSEGLAWRCAAMADYNGNLRKDLFTGLIKYSRGGALLKVLRSKKHIRLYLLYMMEAQKAYTSLQSKVISV